jgi:ABC-type antimicrobial peptide transport system permease subunit
MREFGIRLAIGARRADIVRLVARYVAAIAILGTAAGVGLAVLGTPLVRSMLFGVEPLDPAIYALAAGLLVVVIGLAAAWPTWRATRVQPVEVLRAE